MLAKDNNEKNKETRLMRPQFDAPTFATVFPFPGATPFYMMRRFMDDMDRMFENFGEFRMRPAFSPNELAFPTLAEFEKNAWTPQIEVFKNNDELTIRADLPGLKPEDINLEIANGMLILSGDRKEESEEKTEGFYSTERTYGSFYRSIRVPETVKPENATAKFENGVLEVKIAIPAAELKGRKIEIQAPAPEPKAVGATT